MVNVTVTELRAQAVELAAKVDNAKAYLNAVGIQHRQAKAEYLAARRELDDVLDALIVAERNQNLNYE